MRAALKGNEKR
uniref:Uncharacterized protein n=1 Tax=Anguilla anguilla TaxID=7936 RepID=A0A0E9PKP0_ANGAN